MAEEIDKIFKKLHHQNGPHRAEKKTSTYYSVKYLTIFYALF